MRKAFGGRRGVSIVEYVAIMALISIVAMTALNSEVITGSPGGVGDSVSSLFGDVDESLHRAATGCSVGEIAYGDSCFSATRTASCSGSIPTFASLTGSSTYLQAFSNGAYQPASQSYTQSDTVGDCSFACDIGWVWNSGTGQCDDTCLTPGTCAPDGHNCRASRDPEYPVIEIPATNHAQLTPNITAYSTLPEGSSYQFERIRARYTCDAGGVFRRISLSISEVCGDGYIYEPFFDECRWATNFWLRVAPPDNCVDYAGGFSSIAWLSLYAEPYYANSDYEGGCNLANTPSQGVACRAENTGCFLSTASNGNCTHHNFGAPRQAFFYYCNPSGKIDPQPP